MRVISFHAPHVIRVLPIIKSTEMLKEGTIKIENNISINLSVLLCIKIVMFILTPETLCIAQTADSSIAVQMVTDEADAVLDILAKKISNQPITEKEWQTLFNSEGYIRLKKREAFFQDTFTDEEFKTFVLSDSLAGKYQNLKITLAKWMSADVTDAATRALRYLPSGTKIITKIYPIIKPKANSFVFEVNTDPAIFMYLDPGKNPEKFENTLAHELHHIGYANSCEALTIKMVEDSTIARNIRTVLEWVGAFGEGVAMLAAAGGPDNHPHAFSKPHEKARWDHDMKRFNKDLKKIDHFFLDILDNKLTFKEIQKTGYSFFGIQGPWYTVGWKMAVTIEKMYGRTKLVECICDPRLWLLKYNQAVLEYNRQMNDSLATWSPALIEKIW